MPTDQSRFFSGGHFLARLCAVFLMAGAWPASGMAQAPGSAPAVARVTTSVVGDFIVFDAGLRPEPDGTRVSESFLISTTRVRLFARAFGIETARGPRDRVCVEVVDGPNYVLKAIAVSPVGETPEGLRGASHLAGTNFPAGTFGNAGSTRIRCWLVRSAGAYRVWTVNGATITERPGWTPPAVFSTLEPMADQDDTGSINRNLARLVAGMSLDGMCFQVIVARAPFRATNGYIGQAQWSHPIANLANPVERALERPRNMVPWQEAPMEITPSLWTEHSKSAFVQPMRVGFIPAQDIEGLSQSEKLPMEDLSIQLADKIKCFGSPISYTHTPGDYNIRLNRNVTSAELKKVDLFGLATIFIAMPYLANFGELDKESQKFWRLKHSQILEHEFVHVYDYIELMNQRIFEYKDVSRITKEIVADQRPVAGRPPRDRLGAYGFLQPSLRDALSLEENFITMHWGNAGGYFHRGIGQAKPKSESQLTPVDVATRARFGSMPEFGSRAAYFADMRAPRYAASLGTVIAGIAGGACSPGLMDPAWVAACGREIMTFGPFIAKSGPIQSVRFGKAYDVFGLGRIELYNVTLADGTDYPWVIGGYANGKLSVLRIAQ